MVNIKKSILLVILIVCLLATFSACSNSEIGNIEEINVDEDTIADFYDVKSFNISLVHIKVKYFDVEETEDIALQKNMIKATDQVKFNIPGEHIISGTYNQFPFSFTLKLKEGIEGKYKVIFKDNEGNQLGETQYVEPYGNALVPNVPELANYIFDGWKDQNGNYTSCDNIVEDKIYTAAYIPDFCIVKFILFSGELISEVTIKKGTSAENVAPEFPIIEGKSVSGWNRSLENIIEDTTIVAEYIDDTINVKFVYGDDGRNPVVSNFVANTMIMPTVSPITENSEFLGWYTDEYFEGRTVDFPYLLKNEITFYAKYVSRTKGSEGIEYSDTGNNTYTISGYTGNDEVIVIPQKYNNLDVVGIEDRAFINSNNKRFYVADSNKYFSITSGVLFDDNNEKLIAYPSGKEDFEYTVPGNVKSIENYAFANAKNLMVINFMSEENITLIGDYAFYNCSSLIEFNVPKSIESIGDNAFYMEEESNLSNLTFSLACNIEHIGKEAFRGLTKIKSIELPSGLSELGSSVFYGCNKLSEITIEDKSSEAFQSVKGVLYDKNSEILIAYPSNNNQNKSAIYSVLQGVKTIKSGAFVDPCLVGVELPASILQIEGYAFNSPKLRFIQFRGESEPQQTSDIMFGDYAPEIIIIPEGRQEQYSTISQNYETVYESDDEYHYDLTTKILYTLKNNGELVVCGMIEPLEEITIPSVVNDYNVTNIGAYAFYNNSNTKNVIISEGIKAIDNYAFWKSKGITQITLPDTLEKIGKNAFSDCYNLSVLNYNNEISLNEINEDAFTGTKWYEENENIYLMIGDVLIKYDGKSLEAELPENTKIVADNAFIEKSFLKNIKLNEGLISINSYAFYGCSGIFYIEIPKTVEFIGEYAFAYCPNLYRIIMKSDLPPQLSTLGEAFTTDAKYEKNNEIYQFSIIVPFGNNKYENQSSWEDYNIISLDDRNATFTSETSAQDPCSDNTIYEPKKLSNRAGYVFAGWFEEESIEYQKTHDPIVFPMKLDADITFYARWFDEAEGTDGLEYIKINDGTEYAVYRYTGDLKYVVIPNSYKGKPVTKIMKNAFSLQENINNANVYEIIIPDSITIIEEDAFVDTKWYHQYLGDFLIIGSFLIEYRGNDNQVVVPNYIKYIADGAFENNQYIKKIIFPDSIYKIYNNIMKDCKNLQEIVFPIGLMSIGEEAFANCNKLNNISFPNTLEVISPSALNNTMWISNYVDDCIMINNILYKYKGKSTSLHISNLVNRIEENAFKNNIFLQNLFIPNSVVSIAQSAFEGCINIQNVQFSDNSRINYISERAFYGCIMIENFNLGANCNIREIGQYAFSNCSRLSQADLPKSLRNLGEGAFSNSGIEFVNFEKMNLMSVLEKNTFKSCNKLKTVVFGENSSLHTISESAFENCINLVSIIIPQSIRLSNIESKAFCNCVTLSSVQLPTSLLEIGDDAFNNVPYVESNDETIMKVGSVLLKYKGTDSLINISHDIAAISKGAFKGNERITKIVFEENSQLFAVGEEAFMNCTNLEEIDFPNTLTQIGHNALYNTKYLNDSIEDFVIVNDILIQYKGNDYQAIVPNSVRIIGESAFYGNKKLRNIEIGDNVEKIEAYAFDDMNENSSITMLNENPPELNENNSIISTIYVENRIIFNNYREAAVWSRFITDEEDSIIIKYNITFDLCYEFATIPESTIETNALFIEPKPVYDGFTFIGWYENYNELNGPNDSASYSNLISLPYIVEGDTTLYAMWLDNQIGTYGSDMTMEVLTPDNAEDGRYIVCYNRNDRYVMLPKLYANEEIIGISKFNTYNAFAGKTSLEEINFVKGYYDGEDYVEGSQLKYILEGAFENCTNLKRIELPSTVEYIGENAFRGCTSLEEVVFTESVNSNLIIDKNAFYGCTSLKTITIVSNTTIIGEDAFAGCTALKDIYVDCNVPPTINSPFEIIDGMQIHINRSMGNTLLAAYKGAWTYYEQYIVEKSL